MSENDAAPANEPPAAPAEAAEDPSEVVRFLTHLSPTLAEPAKVWRRGGSVVGVEKEREFGGQGLCCRARFGGGGRRLVVLMMMMMMQGRARRVACGW